MVKAAPNKVRVLGRVIERGPARFGGTVDPKFMLVKVLVEQTRKRRGFSNPLADAAGDTIDVLMPADIAANAPGDRFDADVAMTKPGRAVLVED